MKPAALILWLTLFGGEPSTSPSALVVERPPLHVSSTWVGAWLVGQRRESVTAQFAPVAGRNELTGELRFGEGAAAATEYWVGRLEGPRLRLNRAGIGEARLTTTDDGRLVGRLSRLEATGNIELSRLRDAAEARATPLR